MKFASHAGKGTAASVAALVVMAGLAPSAHAAGDPGDRRPAKAPVAGKELGQAKDVSPKDKLGQHDRDLLAKAEDAKTPRVTVLIAAEKGQTADAAKSITSVGGTVVNRSDKLGYIRASVPTAKVGATAAAKSIKSLDLDETIPLEDPRVTGDFGTSTFSGPSASTPDANPYMPTQDMGSVDFKKAHPTWDGRDVTIGIMDSGVDIDHPALQKTSTGERKILDWFTATDPIFDGDATWRAMINDVKGATATYPGTSEVYTLPDANTTYKINRFSESITAESEPGGDVNRDGDKTDRFGVLYDPMTHDIWVDSNQNRTFEAGEKIAPYAESGQIGHFGSCDVDAAGLRHCMPFTVEYREDVDVTPAGLPGTADFVNIGIAEDAHATHVAGIAAGHALFGGAMNGQAPGAKIVSARACTWGGGCTAAALLDGMVELATNRGVDIINMSIGGLPALNDANNTRANVYDRIVNELNVQLVISAGNSGAGLNTIGDPSVATDTISVASSITKATWDANYGSQVSSALNLHNYSSRGPREDGGFKPNISAPGSAISATPQWLKQADVTPALGYTLPVGYAMFNGTSMASPQAAGGAALLLSAAKAQGKSVTARQLRESIYSSAKLIPGVPVAGQGNGQMNVPAAWAKLAKNPTINTYVVDAPVCTELSGFLKTPNRGTGVYNRCAPGQGGQTLGNAKSYEVTITRTTGRAGNVAHNVSIVGNDGTYSAPKKVTLPLNAPVTFTVKAKAKTVGLHSAYVLIDDPKTSLGDARVMLNVTPAQTINAPTYTLNNKGTVERNRFVSYFVTVPAGLDALQVDMSGIGPGSQVRWIANHPYGTPFESTASTACFTNFSDEKACNSTSRAYSNPTPGVWEFVVEARRTSPQLNNPFTLTFESLGATVTPERQTLDSVTAGAETKVAWTIRNDVGATTLVPTGGPLGSAVSERKTIADGEQQTFTVEVPEGAEQFIAKIGNTADPGADLDLSVYLNGGSTPVAQSADGDSEEAVTIDAPAAGTYTVVIDGYAVPAGSTAYDYLDVFTASALGSLTVNSVPTKVTTGQTIAVDGSIVANVAPAEGRQLFGQMLAKTDKGAVLGTGDVIVTSVTP